MILAQSSFGTHCGKSGHGTNRAEREIMAYSTTRKKQTKETQKKKKKRKKEGHQRGVQTFLRRRRDGGFAALPGRVGWSRVGVEGKKIK